LRTSPFATLPDRQREAYLKLFKVELSDKLRNIVFVYRDKKLAAKFINLNAKDFGKVEQAFKELVK